MSSNYHQLVVAAECFRRAKVELEFGIDHLPEGGPGGT